MVTSEVVSTSDLCMTTLLGHARGMQAELPFGARSWFWAPQPTPHLHTQAHAAQLPRAAQHTHTVA